jgi:nitric oxide reductase subunit B
MLPVNAEGVSTERSHIRLTRKTIAKVIVAAFLLNLVVMGAGAWFAYQEAPPIPEEVVGPNGETVVTGAEVQEGIVSDDD